VVRFPLRLALRPFLLVFALAWVPVAFFAQIDVDVWWPVPSLVAFLPYAVAFSLLVAVASWLLKARLLAAIAMVGVVVLVAPRAGRFTSNDQPPAQGQRIVVATSNVEFGSANVDALLRLVRRERVDVLALQEDTPDITTDLQAAGLRTRLPYGTLQDAPGARGISMYSRWPTTYVPRVNGDKRSVGGLIQLPGGRQIQVRSAHPPPPFSQSNLPRWKATTRSLTKTTRSIDAPTILAGDFNATLDNHPFADVIDRGNFRDAADEAGAAWRPTWSNAKWATLTLDHILVPAGIAVERVTIHDLPGTDHDVVIATLRLQR
jgi:endonuclease/exonuclease/phosphatase (EEP) superfamily protein YafD